MKAIIPAAGQGTRLFPQTHTKPKPMVRVAGKPILGHILDGLVESPIEKVLIVVGVMKEHVVKYVTENYTSTLEVSFVEQETTDGLGHCIYQTRETVGGDSVCIVLGDMLFERGYDHFFDEHRAIDGVDGSLGVKPVENPSNYGVVSLEDGRVSELVEKPDSPDSDLAISGIYFIDDSEALFDALDELIENDIRGAGDEFQLTDGLQKMLDGGAEFGTFEVRDWYDCGRPETLLEANRLLLSENSETNGGVEHHGTGIIVPPVDIGEDVVIDQSVVGPYVSIDDGATIVDSRIRDGIVGEGSQLTDANLAEAIVGNDSTVTGSPIELNVGDSSEVHL